MANQQVSNPPSAAYYLTLIGGILGIIVGIFLLFIIVGIWIIIANVMMIIYAQRILAQPSEHSHYGTYIIILSILSGLNLLCLIGGILAVTYQPMPTIAASQPYQTTAPYTQPTNMHPQSIVHNAVTQSAEKPNFAQNVAKNFLLNRFFP